MTLTLDNLIRAASAARKQSPLHGKTVVVLSEPEIEYREFESTFLETDESGGAVFCVKRGFESMDAEERAYNAAHLRLVQSLEATVKQARADGISPESIEGAFTDGVGWLLEPED